MAAAPETVLRFDAGCPDCGVREAVLPVAPPAIPDDFDWLTRDFDGFRLFMLQELAHRFPERRRWTAADVEVVIVEALAAGLDRLSHALDSAYAERMLETARNPSSVRRHLALIGYDAVELAGITLEVEPADEVARAEARAAALDALWHDRPQLMERARREGPLALREQRRMVTLADHGEIIERHPLLRRARAVALPRRPWPAVLLSVLPAGDLDLETSIHTGAAGAAHPNRLEARVWDAVLAFHRRYALPPPPVERGMTVRGLLLRVIGRFRMIGTEVVLRAARLAPITFDLSVRARPGYFRSELKRELERAFAAKGGMFEPGHFGFGEDLYASDLIEAAMTVEGVEVACLNRFKRVGSRFPDCAGSGVIAIAPDEIASCLNRRNDLDSGYFRVTVSGGETG
ncbi:MAG: hypothetical protein V4574_06125 [Pseudomonadota bacterium]